MSDVIDVTISDADVEIYCQDGAVFDVLWQDEVNLNLDLNLMYIKSGQAEIQSYVDGVSKPEIDNYLNTQAEPIVIDVSSRIVAPLIDDYVTKTSKPELDAFIEAKKPELQAYVDSAQEQANLATEQAEAALSSKNEAASLAENAQAFASMAEQSSLSAVAAQNNAAASASQAQKFAEQASSASAGKANVDLDNLSSAGAAKFNAKQNTITGAASTITSANLATNRALISDGSGKVAVSAVTSTELGYLDGVTSSIQTQLNSKQAAGSYANTSLSNVVSNIDYVIEKGGNNDKWYRKWKSGRYEQGGLLNAGYSGTVTFLKPFTSVPTVCFGFVSSRASSCHEREVSSNSVSTTNFTVTAIGYGGVNVRWYALNFV